MQYAGRFTGGEDEVFVYGEDSIEDVIHYGKRTNGFLLGEAFGVYTGYYEGDDDEHWEEGELIGIVAPNGRYFELHQDIPELEPSPEERHLLEKFDSDIVNLLGIYQDLGVRSELLADAAIGDVESWLEYINEVKEQNDEDNG